MKSIILLALSIFTLAGCDVPFLSSDKSDSGSQKKDDEIQKNWDDRFSGLRNELYALQDRDPDTVSYSEFIDDLAKYLKDNPSFMSSIKGDRGDAGIQGSSGTNGVGAWEDIFQVNDLDKDWFETPVDCSPPYCLMTGKNDSTDDMRGKGALLKSFWVGKSKTFPAAINKDVSLDCDYRLLYLNSSNQPIKSIKHTHSSYSGIRFNFPTNLLHPYILNPSVVSIDSAEDPGNYVVAIPTASIGIAYSYASPTVSMTFSGVAVANGSDGAIEEPLDDLLDGMQAKFSKVFFNAGPYSLKLQERCSE